MGSYPRVADRKGTHELFGPVNKLYCAGYDRAATLFLACLKVLAVSKAYHDLGHINRCRQFIVALLLKQPHREPLSLHFCRYIHISKLFRSGQPLCIHKPCINASSIQLPRTSEDLSHFVDLFLRKWNTLGEEDK